MRSPSPTVAPLTEWAAVAALLLASCGGPDLGVGPSDLPVGNQPSATAAPNVGNFELTFVADRSCTDLPAEARTRTYSATLQQEGSRARLSGGVFADGGPYGPWNTVGVTMNGDATDIWFQDPPIWESLPDGAYLVIYGDAHGRLDAEGATLPFWARFEYCRQREPDTYPECAVPVTTCESRAHQLLVHRK